MIKINGFRRLHQTNRGSKKKRQLNNYFFDLEEDIDFTIAAFQQVYNLDLTKELKTISFKRFLVLLNGLPSDCKLCEIIALRKANPQEIKNQELRAFRQKILLKNKGQQEDKMASALREAAYFFSGKNKNDI